MFEYARRRRMTVNPVGPLEPLSVPTPDTPVLREEEIAALLNACRVAEESAEPNESAWWALARRLTAFALGTALRRGEILAPRWSDVEMLERRLHLRRSLVRGDLGEPKSKAGRRTIGYGPRTPMCSTSSSRRACTGRPTRSSSATRNSDRRSTRGR
jgi:integrase